MFYPLVLASLSLWAIILLLPWRPWSTAEVLDSDGPSDADLSDVTVLIPARNEADIIGSTLNALRKQGPGLRLVVVDDQSTDATAEIVNSIQIKELQFISGAALPAGWTGKLWALEQARQHASTPARRICCCWTRTSNWCRAPSRVSGTSSPPTAWISSPSWLRCGCSRAGKSY